MEQMSLFDDREVYNPLASSCARMTWTDLWDRSIFWERGSCCASSLSRIRFHP